MTVNQPKKNTTTVFGINNAFFVLGSERYNILNIAIQKNGRAEKDPNLMKTVYTFGGQIHYYEKCDFAEKYQDVKSLGLKTLLERTKFLKGQMKVTSKKDNGTVLEFQFPL